LALRNNSPLSCMMVDIDYFKQINDSYGHKVGDDVLKQVANAMQLAVRKEDVVCRLGGEEFLVVCPGVQAEPCIGTQRDCARMSPRWTLMIRYLASISS